MPQIPCFYCMMYANKQGGVKVSGLWMDNLGIILELQNHASEQCPLKDLNRTAAAKRDRGIWQASIHARKASWESEDAKRKGLWIRAQCSLIATNNNSGRRTYGLFGPITFLSDSINAPVSGKSESRNWLPVMVAYSKCVKVRWVVWIEVRQCSLCCRLTPGRSR